MFETPGISSNEAAFMLDEVIKDSSAKAPRLMRESFSPDILEKIDAEIFNPIGISFGHTSDVPDQKAIQFVETLRTYVLATDNEEKRRLKERVLEYLES